MALQGVDKHIVSLPQAAHPVQHGVIFCRQSAQTDVSGLVLFEVIGEGAAGKITGKAHFSHPADGDAIFGGHPVKDGQHVVSDHAVDGEEGILLHPGALLIGIAAGHALVALIEPQRAPRIAHQNFQFQRFAI